MGAPARSRAWIPSADGLSHLGAIPEGYDVEVWDGRHQPPDDGRGVTFYVPPFLARGPGVEVMARLPDLQVVQLLTAGAEAVQPHVPAGVTLCNARGAHNAVTAEWVVGAIIAVLREFPRFVRAQGTATWDHTFTGALTGSSVLIVGYGSIGASLERRLSPFEVEVLRVARRARDGVHALEALPGLLPRADVVVLLVPVTDATRGMVDAAFLARMRDGGLLVNAARGVIVDTDALLSELTSGRLRAALDVTDPEPLPADHPLWQAPGLFLTPHVGGSTPLAMPRAYAIVGEQLRRFAAGEPLHNVVGDY